MAERRHPAVRFKLSGWTVFLGAAALGAAAVSLAPAGRLIGIPQADLGQQFLAWRAYAAAQLAAGHLPLWNPYVYCGAPFLAGFQSALFYPPNLLFLLLPLERAVTASLVLHGLILAAGMWRWARQRGLSRLAACAGTVAVLGSGPVFPQVYAGHLPNVCSLAWIPWILAAVEGVVEAASPPLSVPEPKRRAGASTRRSLAFAAAAAALQILAGQIQYAFYTGVAALLLAAALSFARRDTHALLRAAVILLAGCLLAAAQLFPGLAAAAEGVRQGPLPRSFAAQFSFPPENLLTMLVPGFFGDRAGAVYWGRCYGWEMSLFLGWSALALLACGLASPVRRRPVALLTAAAALLLLLAAGSHTPLFDLLYRLAPGFDRFRGWSKFTASAVVLLSLAVAEGAEVFFTSALSRRVRWIGAATLALALLAALMAWHLRHSSLAPLLSWISRTHESYLPPSALRDDDFVRQITRHAANAVARAAMWGAAAGALLLAAGLRPCRAARFALLALLGAEALTFAHLYWATFSSAEVIPEPARTTAAMLRDGERMQNLAAPNDGYLLHAPDIWGNDPALLRRYAELVALSQGGDPDAASQNVDFRRASPLLRLLRLRWVLVPTAAGIEPHEMPAPLGRAELFADYRVLPDRKQRLAALADPAFDPDRTVVLESAPFAAGIAADPFASLLPRGVLGSATVRQLSPDSYTVTADVTRPAVLLLTDSYSRDWHVGSGYRVMPADHALTAVPLLAGHHELHFRYHPRGLAPGAAVSALAWGLWLLIL